MEDVEKLQKGDVMMESGVRVMWPCDKECGQPLKVRRS